jgi:hypothetical protein
MSAQIRVQLRRPHVVDVLLERIGVGLQLCLCALFCSSDGSLDFRFDVGSRDLSELSGSCTTVVIAREIDW